MFKKYIRKITPRFVLSWYHLTLAYIAAFIYGFPSRKMVVIGITGTKGKSTVGFLLAKTLEQCGYKVGLSGTIMFKVAEKEELNDIKMTMPGRFRLQKLMRQMVQAGCTHAIMEMTSEGVLQHRHKGIDYDIIIFTNLTPEHIERHGSFESYKQAKMKLFENLHNTYQKPNQPKIMIVNSDDKHAKDSLQFPADKKVTTGVINKKADFVATHAITNQAGSTFDIDGKNFTLKILGEFNINNALLVIAACRALNIDWEKIQNALKNIPQIPGRMEIIDEGQNFMVIVDYAHEPKSTESLFSALTQLKKENAHLITLMSSTGGGRDRSRRETLGRLAAKYCDIVIATNEDPYDENPQSIIDDVARACENEGKILDTNLFKILDRQEAIEKAIALAEKNDIVIFPAKGSEQVMAIADGKLIPWDDRKVAKEILQNLKKR